MRRLYKFVFDARWHKGWSLCCRAQTTISPSFARNKESSSFTSCVPHMEPISEPSNLYINVITRVGGVERMYS